MFFVSCLFVFKKSQLIKCQANLRTWKGLYFFHFWRKLPVLKFPFQLFNIKRGYFPYVPNTGCPRIHCTKKFEYCKACIFREFHIFFFKREIFMTRNFSYHTYYIYSHWQMKIDTSLNRRKIKSNKDRINLQTGNKTGIH